MKDFIKRFLQFVKGGAVFLLYFLILPIVLSTSFGRFFESSNKFIGNIALSLAEIFIFFILFLIYRKKITGDFKIFKKEYRKDLDVGFKYYFVGFLIMVTSNLILNLIFGGLAANEEVNRQYLIKYPLYSIVAMVLVGPLVEEIVFRLGFRKAFKKWFPYALFSALLFGGLHVYTAYEGMHLAEMLKNWHEVLYIIPYGALGFAFAKAFYETDNIWTTMTIHLLHNAFTVLLIFLTM